MNLNKICIYMHLLTDDILCVCAGMRPNPHCWKEWNVSKLEPADVKNGKQSCEFHIVVFQFIPVLFLTLAVIVSGEPFFNILGQTTSVKGLC